MLVLRGVPERKKKMSYAQPRQYSALQGVPDGVLVGQAQAGDQRAFEFLVSRYHRPLANYIRGFLKDGEQVSDVLQQVYLQLYVSLPILLTTVSLKGWLFQAIDLRGDRADAQHATDDREDLLLPLAAVLAQSARWQHAPCSRLVV
jgi:DNA-directed RNA polymerase specialized sigma24 family protein